MTNHEQSAVTESLTVNTPEGKIVLDESSELILSPQSLNQEDVGRPSFFNPPRLYQNQSKLRELERRRRWDPILEMIPPRDVDRYVTIKALNVLSRYSVRTLERLGVMTDEDIERLRFAGDTSIEYIKYIRDMAKEKMEQTSSEVADEQIKDL